MKFWWSVKRIVRKLLAGFIEIALGKTKRDMNATLTGTDSSMSACFCSPFHFQMSASASTTVVFLFFFFFLLSSNWPLFHKMCTLPSPEIATDKVIFYLPVIISTVLSALSDLGHWANTGRGNHHRCSVFRMLLLLLPPSRFSRVRLCATPWTAAHQSPPSMDFPGNVTSVQTPW